MAYNKEHEWLVSPLIAVIDSAKLSLDVQFIAGFGENQPDSLGDGNRFGVAASDDNGTTWQVLADWGGTAGGNLMQAMDSLGWHVALPLYSDGNGMRIAFFVETSQTNDDFVLHIDNLNIQQLIDTTSQHNDTTGIEEPMMKNKEWNMWPNPSHSDVTISVAQLSTITVIDMTGHVVITPTPTSSSFIIQRSSLPAGTYFVQIATGDGVTTAKLVIL